jgi:hypothetical protein
MQVLLLMTGMWFTVQATLSALPALLSTVIGLRSATVNTGLLVADVFLVGGYLGLALLGQRFGRRRMLLLAGMWTTLLAPFVYAGMVWQGSGSPPGCVPPAMESGTAWVC